MPARVLTDEDLIPPEREKRASGLWVETDPGLHAAMTDAWAEGLGAHGHKQPRKSNPYSSSQQSISHKWWDRGWLCASRIKRRKS